MASGLQTSPVGTGDPKLRAWPAEKIDMSKVRSNTIKRDQSLKCVPRVSAEMVTINGNVSEQLREVLESEDVVIRRTYDTETGQAERYWGVWRSERVLTTIHEAVVRRWERQGFVTVDKASPTDWRPSSANEYCVINRCDKCGCCGYRIDPKTSLCDDCLERNE